MSINLIRLPAVMARVCLRKTAIYARIKAGQFPAPVKLSPTVSAWPEADIDAWIAAQVAQSREGRAA